MKYNGVTISDIHFGATDSSILLKELSEYFLSYLNRIKKIDFIIITGDYFDHKLYLKEKSSNDALSFMDKIVNISRDNKCPIRLIYGTESHEVDQYKIFSIYEKDDSIDFKIIYKVEEEELLKDLNILYVPEEYVYSKKEYYKYFLSNKDKYDYVFGHGIIQEVMTEASRNSSTKDSSRKKVPVFTTSELINICKGQIYFGHYHINTNIMDKIFYVGSFTRWCYGEEKPKGFYCIKCDTKKREYEQTFIENELAKKFITYTYGYDSSAITSEDLLVEELNKKDKYTEIVNGNNIRYIFNIPENHPNPNFIINVLNERYKFNNNVKVQLSNGYVEKKRKINKTKLNKVMEDYPMIFDKSYKIEDKIVYFIKKKYEYEIDVDIVKKYLFEENDC